MSYSIFMLHGNFVWPPSVKRNRVTGVAKGVVDIHSDKGRDGKYAAFLQWRPVTLADTLPPEPTGNVFNGDDASAMFEGCANKEVCVWIDPRKKTEVRDTSYLATSRHLAYSHRRALLGLIDAPN
jgi:hypothetical protein